MLRQGKAVRNACAHSSNIVNGFAERGTPIDTNAAISHAPAQAGTSRRVRSAKMRNVCLQQIVTLLYLHRRMVITGTTTRDAASERLTGLGQEMDRVCSELTCNDPVGSSFGFLTALFDSWF